jgi:hypothetical protein
VLLSGAEVDVAVRDMAGSPSFVHRKPVFKFDWILFSRQMLIQRALVSEIIKGSKSILSAMATGEILCLKCRTMEGLVPVDPCLIVVFRYEWDHLT